MRKRGQSGRASAPASSGVGADFTKLLPKDLCVEILRRVHDRYDLLHCSHICSSLRALFFTRNVWGWYCKHRLLGQGEALALILDDREPDHNPFVDVTPAKVDDISVYFPWLFRARMTSNVTVFQETIVLLLKNVVDKTVVIVLGPGEVGPMHLDEHRIPFHRLTIVGTSREETIIHSQGDELVVSFFGGISQSSWNFKPQEKETPDEVVFRNLTIRTEGKAACETRCLNIELHQCNLRGQQFGLVALYECQVVVDDCLFDGFDTCVFLHDQPHGRISNCLFQGYEFGVKVISYGYNFNNQATITNCVFKDSKNAEGTCILVNVRETDCGRVDITHNHMESFGFGVTVTEREPRSDEEEEEDADFDEGVQVVGVAWDHDGDEEEFMDDEEAVQPGSNEEGMEEGSEGDKRVGGGNRNREEKYISEGKQWVARENRRDREKRAVPILDEEDNVGAQSDESSGERCMFGCCHKVHGAPLVVSIVENTMSDAVTGVFVEEDLPVSVEVLRNTISKCKELAITIGKGNAERVTLSNNALEETGESKLPLLLKCLEEGCCTLKAGEDGLIQKWYSCAQCKKNKGIEFICESCMKACHSGHRGVLYMDEFGGGSCDCPSKRGGCPIYTV
jgi:hypothetical protein